MEKHSIIHTKLALGIEPPGGNACKVAFEKINDMFVQGKISSKDPLETRIENIISCFEANQTNFIAMMKKQIEISRMF